MKIAVSRISGVSVEDINKKINVDSYEITRLNLASPACSAQSIFYQLYNKPIFESTANVQEALDCLTWCKDIPNVVFGNPKIRNISNYKELELAKSFFKEYCDRYDNIISIEPLNEIYGTNFATSYIDALKFVDELGLDRVMINLDLGSASIANDQIDIHKVNHIHISGQQLQPIREDLIPYYKTNVYKLLELGYNGYISLESLNFDHDVELFNCIIH